jgi:hypothetical protein
LVAPPLPLKKNDLIEALHGRSAMTGLEHHGWPRELAGRGREGEEWSRRRMLAVGRRKGRHGEEMHEEVAWSSGSVFSVRESVTVLGAPAWRRWKEEREKKEEKEEKYDFFSKLVNYREKNKCQLMKLV